MTEDKRIRIACKGAATADWKILVPFQGGLKDLKKDNFDKLRNQILTTGFSAPFIIWKDGGKLHVMDGHQRLRVIKKLVEVEGYQCPPLPVDWVEAISIQEAYRKCLSMASQYGTINQQGLYEFSKSGGLSMDQLTEVEFPDIDMDAFQQEYFEPGNEEEEESATTQGSPEGPKTTCPNCGHEFEA